MAKSLLNFLNFRLIENHNYDTIVIKSNPKNGLKNKQKIPVIFQTLELQIYQLVTSIRKHYVDFLYHHCQLAND